MGTKKDTADQVKPEAEAKLEDLKPAVEETVDDQSQDLAAKPEELAGTDIPPQGEPNLRVPETGYEMLACSLAQLQLEAGSESGELNTKLSIAITHVRAAIKALQ